MNPFKTHGAIAWPELGTSDPVRAANFYKEVFGWQIETMPMPDGDYHVGKVGPANIAGIMQVPDPSMPNAWTFYVTVDDAGAALEKAKSLGATIIVEPMSAPDVGTFFGFMDPTGAVIMAMQWAEMEGAPEVDYTKTFVTPGAFSWFELRTPDIDAAAEFYSELFGWTIDRQQMPFGPYLICKINDIGFAGIMSPPEGEMPPHWGSYVTVEDIEATNKKIAETGGTVAAEEIVAEGVGTFNMFQDPTGAWISAAQYVPMEEMS